MLVTCTPKDDYSKIKAKPPCSLGEEINCILPFAFFRSYLVGQNIIYNFYKLLSFIPKIVRLPKSFNLKWLESDTIFLGSVYYYSLTLLNFNYLKYISFIFSNCSPLFGHLYFQFVDNPSILQIDMVWCYFML